MGSRFVVAACVCVLLDAAPSAAQQVEVGAGLGRTCRGSEGGICGTDAGVPLAAHASVLFGGRLELGIRVAQGGLEDRTFTTSLNFDPGASDDVQVTLEGRSIRYFTGQAIYHFRRSHRVRPMVGVGVGTFVLPRTLRCEPIACESLPPFLVASREARYHFDIVLPIVGLAVQATPRIVVRGGWQPHNIGGEELSSTEWFIAAGWRFGR